MTSTATRLGTRLRTLIERLDGDVERVYAAEGLSTYRPRFTPVVRALQALGSASLLEIAAHSSLSHSAVSQTVSLMRREGLVKSVDGSDGRERRIAATPALTALTPRLVRLWANTEAAARALDAELEVSLIRAIDAALNALERRPFEERIRNVAEEDGRTV